MLHVSLLLLLKLLFLAKKHESVVPHHRSPSEPTRK